MPHILGIAVGFPVMIVAVGFGLDAAFEAFPHLYEILKWVAFAYHALSCLARRQCRPPEA